MTVINLVIALAIILAVYFAAVAKEFKYQRDEYKWRYKRTKSLLDMTRRDAALLRAEGRKDDGPSRL